MYLHLLLPSLLFMGCTHSLHMAHVSDFAPTYQEYRKGELVKARTEQWTFMGFTGNTDYVDQAYRQMIAECPNGSIQGIVSQYSTSHGFFSWTNFVDMQGLCIKQ